MSGSGYSREYGKLMGTWAAIHAETPFTPIAQRWENARQAFTGNLVEAFGYTADEAGAVLDALIAHRLVRLDLGIGRYQLAHGAVWDREILDLLVQEHPPRRV